MSKQKVTLLDVRHALTDIGKKDEISISDDELNNSHLWQDLGLYPDEISDLILDLDNHRNLYVSSCIKRTNFCGVDMTVQDFVRKCAHGY